MTPELKEYLSSFVDFPSPPGVAMRIIELAQDPDVDLQCVAKTLSMDPALAAKVLRVANSAFYANGRNIENLRQALIVVGVNATLTLALSFSLVGYLREETPNGLDYPLFWRRAVLSATAARTLGKSLGVMGVEDLFLSALLQDLGMLALDKGEPELYAEVGEIQLHHTRLQDYERERVGVDHAAVGSWLLRSWNFPKRLIRTVAASHEPETVPADDDLGSFVRCVTLGSCIADVMDGRGQRSSVERNRGVWQRFTRSGQTRGR